MTTTTISDLAAAVPAFRGAYAESFRAALVAGAQPNWSGSELRGKARKFGGHYARQRAKVIDALRAAARARGLDVARAANRARHNRIEVVVVGA